MTRRKLDQIMLATAHIRVSQRLLEDSSRQLEYDLWRMVNGTLPPVYGPPAPPPDPSHRLDSETGECLLCDEVSSDRLAEVCAFEVVPRER